MAWTSTITADGLSMLNSVAGGSSMTITGAKTSTTVTATPATATDVGTNVSDAVTNVIRRTEASGVRFIVKVYSSPTAYKMKEIGIFGSIDGGTEKLFVLLQNSDGVDIPTSANFPDFVFNVALFLETDKASSFTATVDPTAMVSSEEFEETMELIDAHFAQVDEALEHLLPEVTSADNGKFLVVEDGEWAAVQIASASGGAY